MGEEEKPRSRKTGRKVLVGSMLAFFVLIIVIAESGGGGGHQSAPNTAASASVTAAPRTPLPTAETALIRAVDEARQTYATAANDMAKGAARPTRARAICRFLRNRAVLGWIGTVRTLSTNGDGKGVLGVRIAPHVTVETWNNDLSDLGDKTLIAPASPLFTAASALHKGQLVIFSGRFFHSSTDCIEESSITLEGSLDDPGFIFRFATIAPAH